jgi:pimeloyl-ACP methyl ester carboxylesterase
MDLDQQRSIPALRFAVSCVTEPVHVHYDVLAPAEPSRRPPVVMVHGGGHSGSGYLATADFRPGWAHVFAARGWPAIVPDWPGCGRSGYIPSDTIDGETVCRGLGAVLEKLGRPVVLLTHSMSGAFGWRLMETHGHLLAAVVGVAPAPPGNIQPEPAIARESDDEIELELGGRVTRLRKVGPNKMEPAFVTAKLVGNSRFFPRERLASYGAALRAIEGRLLLQRQNVRGSQVRVGDTGRLKGQRVLVLTGTEDLDHPRAVDEAIVAWLNACGARAEYLYLGDRGIVGNGHMLMLERNSDAIAALILDWLDRAVPD